MGATLQCQFFETDLGPVFLAWKQGLLVRLQYGSGASDLPHSVGGLDCEIVTSASLEMQIAREQITRYARGDAVRLDGIPVDMRERTDFQVQVLLECQKIARGSVVSYGELACRIGRPRAARAVGSVMRTNRHPLVIPCHRVIAANGRLGGYSADDGVRTKARLLAREGVFQYAEKMGLG